MLLKILKEETNRDMRSSFVRLNWNEIYTKASKISKIQRQK